MEEIIVNFWIYVDIGTDTAYNWCGKMYCVNGTDDEKLKLLVSLSENDFKTVKRRNLSDKLSVIVNGETMTGKLPASCVDDYFDSNADWFCVELENELPDIFIFGNGAKTNHLIKQKLPTTPLYVLTILMENENGEVRPVTTNANKEWIKSERLRLRGLH
ncbi:hypothetical protein ACFQZI_13170 [Mucilaginibacter lutimaris]|uniref:Uncharacterized protein n=1 Tax=Mucilaginibacter lutimaris TaxID=931629 RepID=A0ABW2ZHY0_9SPHI